MIKLHSIHGPTPYDKTPPWARAAAARRESAIQTAEKLVEEKAAAVFRATGKRPHQSLMSIMLLIYAERSLGHAVDTMMIGTDGYYVTGSIIGAEDIEEGNFDMSVDGVVFTLYHNPKLPPFTTAVPLKG